MLMQALPRSQTSEFTFELHSQVAGVVALLQVSAFSKHWSSLKHEQAGCPIAKVRLRHVLPVSQGVLLVLKLHWQAGGDMLLLQVSEVFPKQSDESKHEHAGWSGLSVVSRHVLLKSQGAKFSSALLLQRHVGRIAVVLHVSDVSPMQSDASKQEHAG